MQLIDTRTGYQRWSETYDRPLRDVFAVQDEISRAIVGALQVKLGGGRAEGALAREETADPEAHVLVLKAIALLAPNTREGVTRGVVLLGRRSRAIPGTPGRTRSSPAHTVCRPFSATAGATC